MDRCCARPGSDRSKIRPTRATDGSPLLWSRHRCSSEWISEFGVRNGCGGPRVPVTLLRRTKLPAFDSRARVPKGWVRRDRYPRTSPCRPRSPSPDWPIALLPPTMKQSGILPIPIQSGPACGRSTRPLESRWDLACLRCCAGCPASELRPRQRPKPNRFKIKFLKVAPLNLQPPRHTD
jgi:hypothetical protein